MLFADFQLATATLEVTVAQLAVERPLALELKFLRFPSSLSTVELGLQRLNTVLLQNCGDYRKEQQLQHDCVPDMFQNVNVGVLGHVDSGKTSIVRALSTELSTAALDKHPQSKERGITLDLGFSARLIDAPEGWGGVYLSFA